MCGIAHRPVPEDSCGRASADADGDCLGPHEEPDCNGEQEDVQGPGSVEEPEPGVSQDVAGKSGIGSVVCWHEPEVEVPEEVSRDGVVVGEVWRAVEPVLPEVPSCVQPHPGERTPEAAQHEQVDQ